MINSNCTFTTLFDYRLPPPPAARLISCSWYGSDSRQHHLQQGGLAHACLLQPLRCGSLHDLHLTSALVAGPEWPALQPCAPQPHAGYDATSNGPGAYEHGHGRPRNEPRYDAGQPHGYVLQWALTHGPPGLVPAGARRCPPSTADFGWAGRHRRSDGSRGVSGRRSNDGCEHQPFSSLKKCHQPPSPPLCSLVLTSRLPPSFTPQHNLCQQKKNVYISIFKKKNTFIFSFESIISFQSKFHFSVGCLWVGNRDLFIFVLILFSSVSFFNVELFFSVMS